jgi:hypothetical protein
MDKNLLGRKAREHLGYSIFLSLTIQPLHRINLLLQNLMSRQLQRRLKLLDLISNLICINNHGVQLKTMKEYFQTAKMGL